jgi:hypothetical protein
MTPIVPVLGVGALAWLMLRGKAEAKTEPDSRDPQTRAPKPSNAAAVKRLVEESREIIRGKRDAYSDDPGRKVTPRGAATRVAEAKDNAALQAAREAARDGAKPAPKPKPAPDMRTGVRRKPAQPRTTEEAAAAQSYGQSRVEQGSPVAAFNPDAEAKARGLQGYDRAKAAATAGDVAKHLAGMKAKGKWYDYSRPVVRAWQTVAGVPPDGIYARGTAAALKHFTPAAPKAFFAKGSDSYWGAQ